MRIDIWSDVVCPWCAIGMSHLETALSAFEHSDEVEVVWRSFELDPGAPSVRSGDYVSLLARKYGASESGARAMVERMTRTAAESGLDFDLLHARPGNTFDAHRLVHLAADRGLQMQVKKRFFQGYLSEGAAIGDHDELERLAVDAGLDGGEVRTVLVSDAYAEAVRADEDAALRIGASAVPLFVVDRRLAVSGAQPPDVLLQVLRRAWDERAPVVVAATGDGNACGPEGCAV